MTVLLIVLGALMLIGLVIVHELGHFYAARKAGVEVEEFGVGFPPKAKVLAKKNGTMYTLNWLPLGGFVRLKGEHDSDTAKGSYGAASLPAKVRIMVAGVLVNLVVAVLLMSIVAAISLPRVFDDKQFMVASDTKILKHDVVASYVAKDSPAAKGGIEVEDRLLGIWPTACELIDSDGCQEQLIKESEDLGKFTSQNAAQEVRVRYIDATDEQEKTTTVTLLSEEEVRASREENKVCKDSGKEPKECPPVRGFLGISPDDYIEQRATWSAPIVGVVFSGQVIKETFVQFGSVIGGLFRGDTQPAEDNVTGVLGIGYTLGKIAERGFTAVLFLTAIISLSLAIMNVLPIPALDGGRLFVTLLFRVLKKPLTKEVEERVHGTGFALLMVLFLLVTILDVKRFIF